jgi:hypothetical protein
MVDLYNLSHPVTPGNAIVVQTCRRTRGVNDSQGNTYVRAPTDPRLWDWVTHPLRSFRTWRSGRIFYALNVHGGPTVVTLMGGTFKHLPIEVETSVAQEPE